MSLTTLLGLLALTRRHDAWAVEPEPIDVTSNVEKFSLDELMDVRISPFEVSTARDHRYRAFSSVTASRLDTPIADLPFPIQVFVQPFVEDLKPVTIYDVAKYSPSVTYRSNDFNEGNANLAIRGFAVGTYPGSVQVLRDGFHGPSIFEFTNVSRLEIVKGPSSFLYGQVAPGGIVNIITKTPRSEFGMAARVRLGSYGAYRFEGDVTGPLHKELSYRVTTSVDQDIHYWHPYDGHSFDIAPALRWQPNRWMTLTVKQEFYRKLETPQIMQKPGWGRQQGVVPTPDDPNLAGVEVSGLPDDWNSMSATDFRTSDTSSLTATLDVAADEHWDLRAVFAHQKYEVDAVFSGNIGLSNEFRFIQGRRRRVQDYTNRGDTFEVNASGRYQLGFATLRLLLGAQYVARQFDSIAGQVPNDPAIGPIPSPVPDWDLRDPSTWDRSAPPLSDTSVAQVADTTRYRDRAAFAGATLGFFDDRLLVLAGGRLTETESQATDHLVSEVRPVFTASKLTPQYGVLYKLLPGLSLFTTYAESFVPSAGTLMVRNVVLRAAEPTQGRGFDIGAKLQALRGRLSGTVTAFEVRNENILNDIAELDPSTGQQVFTRVQSGEQRCSGIELDATLTPIDNWQTYLSYSYNNARIVEFSGHDASILAGGPSAPGYKEVAAFHGAPLQMSAPHLASLWTRYDIASGAFAGHYLAGGGNLVVDQTLLPDSPANNRQTYALFDALVGYSWQLFRPFRANVELYGKNLTNQHYRPSQSSRSRPREVGIALTVKH